MAESETESHLNPVRILHTVEDVMSDNSIIVADGGDFVGTAAYILRSHKHRTQPKKYNIESALI